MNQKTFLDLNEVMAIQAIIKHAQQLDTAWGCEGHLERVRHLEEVLTWCLLHRKAGVRALAAHRTHIHPEMTQEHFLSILIPLERSYTKGVMDHDIVIEEGDKQSNLSCELVPLYVVLDNIRSSFNVGAAFRNSECFAVETLFLCGYTATPKNAKTAKTSMGTSELVNWEYARSSVEAIESLKARGVKVLAVETVPKSHDIYSEEFTEPTALVFGNERHGINHDVILACDSVVHIPLFGHKNSLNVGVTIGACLSEARRKGLSINRESL